MTNPGDLPAFPQMSSATGEQRGMTLRDAFAMFAPPAPYDYVAIPRPPEAMNESTKAYVDWFCQNESAKPFSWPWHYADQVLARRGNVEVSPRNESEPK